MMPRHHRFVKAVADSLRHRCQVAAGERVLAAVSGGADSVALLRALAALAPGSRWRLTLSVGHVQHHLRPPEQAERDAAFVETLARELDLPFLRADLEPFGNQGNMESWARRARYEALATMADTVGAGVVAVAHHADDQLETLLMRLLRGASVQGLACMSWRRRLTPGSPVTLVRPMLAVDRAAVHAFLRDLDQHWCEDHTNADVNRMRSRLRQQVLPVLHSLRRRPGAGAVNTTDHLRQVAALLDEQIDTAALRLTAGDPSPTQIDRAPAAELPQVVLVGTLRRLLMRHGASADALGAQAMRPLTTAVRDGQGGLRVFEFAGGLRATVTRDHITFVR